MSQKYGLPVVLLVIGLIVGAGAVYAMTSGNVSQLQGRVTTLEQQVATLQSQITSKNSEITGLQTQLASKASEIASLQSQLSAKTSELSTLQTKNAALEANITILSNQISILQYEVARLGNQTPVTLNVKTYIPQGFTLVGNNSYIDSLNYYNFVGELQYSLTGNVEYVVVHAAFFNNQGALIDTDYGYTAVDILQKGTLTPFRVDSEFGTQVSQIVLTVVYDTTSEIPYRSFEYSGVTTRYDSLGYLDLSGMIKNTGTSQAKYVKAIVTFYDNQMKILDYDETYCTPSTLDPNQTGAFEADLRPSLASKCKYYSIMIETT